MRFPMPAVGPANPHVTELTIRRSRFLTQTCQAGCRDSALAFVARIRDAHPDAAHNCWAYAAGAPGSTAGVGSSDDGEPHGTAGRPMLSVLLHCGIGRICVVVSRWFGGVKLGTGGLVRAYQDSVLANLAGLPVEEAVPREIWRARAPYAAMNAIRRGLPSLEAVIVAENYDDAASLDLSVPQEHAAALAALVSDAARGAATLARLEGAETGARPLIPNFLP